MTSEQTERVRQVRARIAALEQELAEARADQAEILAEMMGGATGDEVAAAVGLTRQQVYKLMRHARSG